MADPRRLADEFVSALRREAGDRITAAALFGSVARDEWIEGVSDVNVLVLVDDIDMDLLARAAPAARSAMTRGVRPLVMEMEEWHRAADVFTIELADMADAHVALHGADPAAHLDLDKAVLRLQAERELRAKLLHLHAGMLVASDDRKRLGQLFVHALPSFITYMRAALRLAARPVPMKSSDVIEAAAALTGAAAEPFQRVLKARTSGEDFQLGLSDPVADAFNTSAEQLASHIDAQGR
jgi:predicted nucleotidyltransferase